MLEGKSVPSNVAANTNHTTLSKNQSAIKYLPSMRFPYNFLCKIIFMCSVSFWHRQDSNSLFKGSIGQVTISASGLLSKSTLNVPWYKENTACWADLEPYPLSIEIKASLLCLFIYLPAFLDTGLPRGNVHERDSGPMRGAIPTQSHNL